MIRFFFIVLSLLLLTSCKEDDSNSGSQKNANLGCRALLKQQGAKAAFPLCYKEASSGYPAAQYELGQLYEKGEYVNQSAKWANFWYHKAANQHYVAAELKLANAFAKGWGEEQSDVKAFHWYEKAAMQGNITAQTIVGLCYLEGRGTAKDIIQGKSWLVKSAGKDDNQARYELSKLLLARDKINSDESKQAIIYLNEAAQSNHIPAMLMLADLYRVELGQKDNAARLYAKALEMKSPEGQYHVAILIKNHQLEAPYSFIDLIRLSSAQGFAPAELELGMLYEDGNGVKKDPVLAFQYYLAAAKKEEPIAAYHVGLSYIFGYLGQEKNVQEGIKWLKIAAQKGAGGARYILASLYLEGYPVLESKKQAVEYLYQSAKAGSQEAKIKLAKALLQFDNPKFDQIAFQWLLHAQEEQEAKYLLGEFYQSGIGTPVNYEKAIEIFQELADKDHPLAQSKLATLYYFGQGVEPNLGKAKYYFLASAKQGVPEAKNWLNILFKEEDSAEKAEEEMMQFTAEVKEPEKLYNKAVDLLYQSSVSEFQIEEGLSYLKSSATKNYLPALKELGSICEQSLFGCNDMMQACDWYKQAALLGDVYSQYHLAEIYYVGIGIEKDYVTSFAFASMAARANHQEAILLKEDIMSVLNEMERTQAEELYQQLSSNMKS